MFTRAKNALESMALSESPRQSRISPAWLSLQALSPAHIRDAELARKFATLYEKHYSSRQGQDVRPLCKEEVEVEIKELVDLCANLIQYSA